MELTGNQNIEKYAEQCVHCMQNTLLPIDHEWTCLSCGCNIWMKRKNELTKSQGKNLSIA